MGADAPGKDDPPLSGSGVTANGAPRVPPGRGGGKADAAGGAAAKGDSERLPPPPPAARAAAPNAPSCGGGCGDEGVDEGVDTVEKGDGAPKLRFAGGARPPPKRLVGAGLAGSAPKALGAGGWRLSARGRAGAAARASGA